MLKKTVGQTQRQKAEIAKLKGAQSTRPLSPYALAMEPSEPNTPIANISIGNTPDAHTTSTSTTTENPLARPTRRAATLALGKPLIDQFNSEGGESVEQPSGPSP